jgi:predicted nucleic acid-binding protein
MPRNTVVDASALAAVMFAEPAREEVAARIEGALLIAPHLLPFELANICLSKCRRHPDLRNEMIAQFGRFAALNIDLRDVDFPSVRALADETGLTAYDASYLWLARVLDADLVTLDRELAKAHASFAR